MDWPRDADGDVFRRLRETGFDFSKRVKIDFEVYFPERRSTPQAAQVIAHAFPAAHISPQEDGLLVQVDSIVTYELVTRMQAELSDLAARFGGACNEWGVLVASRPS